MSDNQTIVTQLLQIYHGSKLASSARNDLPTIEQLNYLCDIGLGPIAFQVYGDLFKQSAPPMFSVLQSADLTTRVLYSQLERAMAELVSELQTIAVIPTLLKGISTSDEFYTPPYLRIMGDIDILVKPSEVERVLRKIAELGYETTDEQWRNYQTSDHHLPAARHPITGVTLEVHTRLFAIAEFYSREPLFQPDNFNEQLVAFDYNGLRATRFAAEFQFVFIVSKWSVDRDWAVNLKNINDIIHILKKYESQFDWPVLSHWFASNPHLYPVTAALLHYLEQANILAISPPMRELLACSTSNTAPRIFSLQLWLLHKFPFSAGNKRHEDTMRWYAHAAWLYFTKPRKRNLGIPGTILYQFYLSVRYGKYSPIRQLVSRYNNFFKK